MAILQKHAHIRGGSPLCPSFISSLFKICVLLVEFYLLVLIGVHCIIVAIFLELLIILCRLMLLKLLLITIIFDVHHVLVVHYVLISVCVHQWFCSIPTVSNCIWFLICGKVVGLDVFVLTDVGWAPTWVSLFTWSSWTFALELHWIIWLLIKETFAFKKLLAAV